MYYCKTPPSFMSSEYFTIIPSSFSLPPCNESVTGQPEQSFSNKKYDLLICHPQAIQIWQMPRHGIRQLSLSAPCLPHLHLLIFTLPVSSHSELFRSSQSPIYTRCLSAYLCSSLQDALFSPVVLINSFPPSCLSHIVTPLKASLDKLLPPTSIPG